MSNEIQVGAAVLSSVEALIATLSTWHPFVGVYVDGTNDPLVVGTRWNVYARTAGTRTLIASGIVNTNAPLEGQRVLTQVKGLGDTIELWATCPSGTTNSPIQGAIVGWDSGTITAHPSDSVDATVSLTPGPETQVLSLVWHPFVTVFVQAPAKAIGSYWRLHAIIPGFSVNVPIAGALYDDVSASRALVRATGGSGGWTLTGSAPAGNTGPVNVALFGTSTIEEGSVLPVVTPAGIIFRPGVPSNQNHVATWAEIQTAITAAEGNIIVYIDDTFAPAHVPASSGITQMFGRVTLSGFALSAGTPVTLFIDDGAQLFASGFTDKMLRIVSASTTIPALDFPPSVGPGFPALQLDEGAELFTGAGGTVPMIRVAAGNFFTLKMDFMARLNSSATPGVPIVELGAGSSLLLLGFGGSTYTAGDVTGPVGSTLQFVHDDQTTVPIFPGFLGTFIDQAQSVAGNEGYNDTGPLLVPAPAFGPGTATVQEAIDALKALTGGISPADGVIYREGGVAFGNVYTSFPAAYAAAVAAGVCTIYFDDALGAPVVPAGAYDLLGLELAGYAFHTGTVVTVQNGATFTNLTTIRRELLLESVSASAVFTTPAGFHGILQLLDGSSIFSTIFPFIDVPAGANTFFADVEFGGFFFAGAAAVRVGAGATLQFNLGENATIGANTLTGAGTVQAFFKSSAALLNTAQAGLGTLSRFLRELATKEFYADSPPLLVPAPVIAGFPSVQEAIDAIKNQINAQLVTLTGSTPGAAPGESVELAPNGAGNFILNDNSGYTLNMNIEATGKIGGVAKNQSFIFKISALRVAGLTTIEAMGASEQFGSAAAAGWFVNVVVGVAPDRIAIVFNTGPTTSHTNVTARVISIGDATP